MGGADTLDDLANKINVCASKADDYRVTAACHLAEAKRLCREQGITFKDWVSADIKFSYDEARKLAVAGESGDPTKAIADMRVRSRDSMSKSRAVQRGTAGATIQIIEHDGDDDEPRPPHHLDSATRVRGFMHRAQESKEMAEADDLSGLKITRAMLAAAEAAADAWNTLAADLMEKRASQKPAARSAALFKKLEAELKNK